jgi:hypothetical protein
LWVFVGVLVGVCVNADATLSAALLSMLCCYSAVVAVTADVLPWLLVLLLLLLLLLICSCGVAVSRCNS